MQIPSPYDLARIFDLHERLGAFEQVDPERVPEPHQQLLVHHDHMTVSMERFHDGPVEVDVLQHQQTNTSYAREILLRRRADRAVVQYGIVRLRLDCFPDEVRSTVLSREVPLGRILISRGLFRHVELGSIWQVKTTPDFRSRCETVAEVTFGRTALIHLNEIPAIELLEVVVLESTAADPTNSSDT
ncbi:MAG: hypothetical protein AAGF97_05390 [Planctomycetota bacterium]